MSDKEEWISAASAVALLGMKHYSGTRAICQHAHAGLVKARARRYIRDERSTDNFDAPKEFWWAEGGDALTQDWMTGHFDTWTPDQRIHLQAFGVSFLRTDIEKMVPSGFANPSSAPNAPVVAKDGRSAIMLTALDVETRAVLRHLTDVHEQTVRGGTVFHVGQFKQWRVAIAECGEGNASAASIAERGMAQFHPEVALFVGVAGGVKDVTIGDAVVASKVYGYERGKDTGDGFKARPIVNLTDHALEQRARALKLKDDWQRRLDPEIRHPKPQKVRIGAIAAGEKVVASSAGEIARFLKDNYGDTLAVEMEGQGFLTSVHVNAPVQGCVIRGISDLLDGKADADQAGSQERAADVASAVAFEMLATLEQGQAKASASVLQSSLPVGPIQPSAAGETETSQRQSEARRCLAPELSRSIERVLYIHDRARVNFTCAWADNGIKPNDRKEDFIPYWPVLYPTAPQVRDLAGDDAAALVAFYDSLHSLADFVNDWWEREGQMLGNIFNMILHHADKSLKLALICVEKFELEKLRPPLYQVWGTISSRIERSMAAAEEARKHHLAKFEAKAASKTPPLPQQPHRDSREAKLRVAIVELARNWLNALDTLLAKCPQHVTTDKDSFLRFYVPSDFDIPMDGLAAVPLHEIGDAVLVTAVLTLRGVMGQVKQNLDDVRAKPAKVPALDGLRGQRTPAFNAFASVLRIVEGPAAEQELSRVAFRA